jgi:scyllo-inositol 2-dehydrogenase (NADP+)
MSNGKSSPTNRPLKGAIIGFGKVAEAAHLPALEGLPDLRIVAVADPLPARRARARELLGEVPVFADLESLLASGPRLDFAVVCTPPGGRLPLVAAVLRHGCHVLSEKPLALDEVDFQELELAQAAGGSALVSVNNWKYAPLLSLAGRLLQEGAIGRLQHLDWQVYRTTASGGGLSAWRQDPANSLGGILVDHGWHAFYLLMAWAGAEPQSLRANLRQGAEESGVEVEAEVELEFPGATARLFLTWLSNTRSNRGKLAGSAGEIILADDRLSRLAGRQVEEERNFPEKLSAGSHHPQWMAGVFGEFLEEIRSPEKRGRNFREAKMCGRLISLAYSSHQAGGAWIDVASGRVASKASI